MSTLGNIELMNDFTSGYQAGLNGDECPQDAGEHYVNGYNAGYARAQIEDHRTEVSYG